MGIFVHQRVGANRPIAVVVGRAAVGELAECTIPVLTVATFYVHHLFPAHLTGEEQAFVPIRLLRIGSAVAVPAGIGFKEVHDGWQLCHRTGIVIGCRCPNLLRFALGGVTRPTERCRHVVVAITLVVTCHNVDINVVAADYVLTIYAVVFHRSHIPSGGVAVGEALKLRAVHVQATLQRQPVEHLVASRHRAVGAFFNRLTAVLIHQPIGVVMPCCEISPLLSRTAQLGGSAHAITSLVEVGVVIRCPCAISHIIGAIVVHIHISRSQIEVVERIEHGAAAWTVAVACIHIVERHVDVELVVEQRIALTKRECITVVRVVWHHAVGMGIGIREIGANLLGTAAHAHRVVPCHAGLKEIGNVVLGKVAKLGTLISQLLGGHVSHLLAPAFGREGAGCQVQGCAINILDFWLGKCLLKCHIRVHRDGNLAFLAFFGGNHEHTVGCRATIKRRSICALEHVDALDVVGVDERKRIAAFRRV